MTPARYMSLLFRQAPSAVGTLVFRSLPFVVYAAISGRTRWRFRVGTVAAFACLVIAANRLRSGLVGDLIWAPAVFVYFVLCAAVVHWLCGVLPARSLRAGAMLFVAATLFVVVPALSIRSAGVDAIIVVGWEASLSAHSYAVDTIRGRPKLRDALFFLLVNPSVIYAESHKRIAEPGDDARSILRVARGAVTMVGRDAALMAIAYVPQVAVTPRPPV